MAIIQTLLSFFKIRSIAPLGDRFKDKICKIDSIIVTPPNIACDISFAKDMFCFPNSFYKKSWLCVDYSFNYSLLVIDLDTDVG